jgi:hypothetical protein
MVKRIAVLIFAFNVVFLCLNQPWIDTSLKVSAYSPAQEDTLLEQKMTIWHSSDFGWTAGQDISKPFAALAKGTFKPGDTVILDHMYKIGGSGIQLPDNFTLAAVKGGGFDVYDSAANSAPLISLGNGNKLDNLTVTHSKAPNTGYEGNNPAAGVDYHYGATFEINGKHDVTIESSKFKGNVAMFFDVMGSDNLTVRNSHFDGAAYQMRWGGLCTDFRVENSLFQNALVDGIKTIDGGGAGTQRATIVNSVFENGRDGIDVAGGFKDSVISKSIFRNNSVTGLDLKKGIDGPADLNTNYAVSNITINDSQFIDNQNGIVVTMLDKAGLLTAANADVQMPHDIHVSNSIFEKTAGGIGKAAFLIKDGHHINWDNIKILGDLDEMRLMNAEAPEGWSAHHIGGTSTTGVPRPAWNGYPFVAGPVQGGESAPPPSGGTGPAEPVTPLPPPEPETPPAPEPAGDIAINAGGPAAGEFAADVHFAGGLVYATGAAIAGTTEDAVYQTERHGNFGYVVGVADGTYEVTLKFAEIFFGEAGKRLFDVKAENQIILDDFDVFKAAGGKNVALDRTFEIAVTDGMLNLDFIGVTGKAKVSAIVIDRVEGTAPEPTPEPVKINAGGKASGDFSADVHFAGGGVYGTAAAIAGTADDAVYQTERFGNFGYAVDVANGAYEVTLKFAEIFFGAAGKRLFDVKAEGKLVLNDLDVFKAAGGKNVALDRTITVNVSDGELNLDFVSVRNNAKLSGIEIVRAEAPKAAMFAAPAPEAGSPYDLVFSTSADRAWATDLDGGVLEGDVFVFTRGTGSASKVAFYLDDGQAAHLDRLAFHDFVGTRATGDALPWDTAALADGEHTITAEVVTADGSTVTISDSFIVDNF